MIRLIFPILLFCCSLNVASNNIASHCCELINEYYSNPCLIYKFGFSKIITIKVEKNNDAYDIFIYDSEDKILVKSIEGKIQILEWALNDMPTELEEIEFERTNIYSDVFYELSIVCMHIDTIVCSSSKRIIGNLDFTKKIDILKSFLVELWVECLVQTSTAK